MKRMLLALCLVTATVLPSFAAQAGPGAPGAAPPPMHHEHGMMPHMMQDPQHLLAMAYHKNLIAFGQALKKAARQGDTVPGAVVRAAVTEMRRSQTQMEIYHEQAARTLPPEQKAQHAAMEQAMSAHMAQAKTQLAQLDELGKADRVDSRELIKRLEPLLKGCMEMGGMHGPGMGRHGKGMHRGSPCGCGHGDAGCCGHGDAEGCAGCGMGCGDDGGCSGCGGAMHGAGMRHGRSDGWGEMMQQRQKMMAAMKAQDAELARLVDEMNRAPKDRKQDVMAQLLTRMVRQRAEMVAQMEQLQEHMKRHMRAPMGGAAPSGAGYQGAGDRPDEMTPPDMDSDSDFDDVDVNDEDMDMGDMQMEE